MLALFLLVFSLVLFADAYSDAYLIQKGLPIDHTRGTLVRVGTLLLFSLFYCSGQLIYTGLWLCAWLAIYWLLFDFLLNRLRGLDWYYVGKDALLDKLLGRFQPIGILILKGTLIGLTLWAWLERAAVECSICATVAFFNHLIEILL